MGEWRYRSIILDLGTRWRQMVSFTAMHLSIDKRACGTYRIGGCVGPKACLDTAEKRIPDSARNRNPAVRSIACHYTNRVIEDNIKINPSEKRLEVVGWIHLAQDRDQWQALVNISMNLQFA
jgi:hypothetical protein